MKQAKPQIGRERTWAAIRRAGHFTLAEIAARTGVSCKNLHRMIRALVKIGHLKATTVVTPGRRAHYKLVRDTGPQALLFKKDGRVYDPNLGEIFTVSEGGEDVVSVPFTPEVYSRQWAWQTMRILRTFSAFQIAATAEISYNKATRYTLGLARAGYLRLVRKSVIGQLGSYTIWQLIRDTGPNAPIYYRRNGRVYDPNLNQIFEPVGLQAPPGIEKEGL